MRNRCTTVKFPIFSGYKVRIILSNNIKTTCRRLGHPDVYPCEACFIPGEYKCWLVFSAQPDEGTIAHEASHAIQELFRTVGSRRDEESFAYHLDYLVGRIHKFLKSSKNNGD
jgi:hypothetical protein